MGGDGSMGVFVKHAVENEIILQNMKSLIFVPLPYGTGNDLCRALGWGGKEGKWAKSLETMVNSIINAKEDKLALWSVDISAEVHSLEGRKFTLISDEGRNYRKFLCCYFNLGLDAFVNTGNTHLY